MKWVARAIASGNMQSVYDIIGDDTADLERLRYILNELKYERKGSTSSKEGGRIERDEQNTEVPRERPRGDKGGDGLLGKISYDIDDGGLARES